MDAKREEWLKQLQPKLAEASKRMEEPYPPCHAIPYEWDTFYMHKQEYADAMLLAENYPALLAQNAALADEVARLKEVVAECRAALNPMFTPAAGWEFNDIRPDDWLNGWILREDLKAARKALAACEATGVEDGE